MSSLYYYWPLPPTPLTCRCRWVSCLAAGWMRWLAAVAVHSKGDVDANWPVASKTSSFGSFPSWPAKFQLPKTRDADQRRFRITSVHLTQRTTGRRSRWTDVHEERDRLLPCCRWYEWCLFNWSNWCMRFLLFFWLPLLIFRFLKLILRLTTWRTTRANWLSQNWTLSVVIATIWSSSFTRLLLWIMSMFTLEIFKWTIRP